MTFWKRTGHKYGATRVKHAGYSFASKLEAALFDKLKARELAREIRDLQVQPSVYLTEARILYKPDFKHVECVNDEEVYSEAKGFETPEWRIKRRLWIYYGPGRLEIYKGSRLGIFLSEELTPKGDE